MWVAPHNVVNTFLEIMIINTFHNESTPSPVLESSLVDSIAYKTDSTPLTAVTGKGGGMFIQPVRQKKGGIGQNISTW